MEVFSFLNANVFEVVNQCIKIIRNVSDTIIHYHRMEVCCFFKNLTQTNI